MDNQVEELALAFFYHWLAAHNHFTLKHEAKIPGRYKGITDVAQES